ncbi:MAG: ACP S-malonyltransferase [Gammaproteobacteria bacterium]|nr:ACP S-malonyltransferase [Gammaproteobacteria bacterium]
MGLGFLFPGQGAQEVGMVGDIGAVEDAVYQRFEEASDVLGFDLGDVVANGPAERLNETEVTQPALLTAGVALLDVWRCRNGAEPEVVAGHSLGEYSALVAAGSLDFRSAVVLVHERGKLMQGAVPAGQGAMAAILGLDDEVVEESCEGIDGTVTPANYNSSGQVVIAGAAPAVAAAIDACKDRGARRAVPLDVSVPSHCALMAPASEPLAELLSNADIRDPVIPVVQNYSAVAATDRATIRDNLLRQLVSPVRWSASVGTMSRAGTDVFVECGPGSVLAGLARRIDRSLAVHGIGTLDGLESALEACAGLRS